MGDASARGKTPLDESGSLSYGRTVIYRSRLLLNAPLVMPRMAQGRQQDVDQGLSLFCTVHQVETY